MKKILRKKSGEGNGSARPSWNYCGVTSFCIVPFLLSLKSSSPTESNRETPEIRHKTNTKKPSLDLTIEELEVLLPLASDQLFRKQFIDTRFPGLEKNIPEIQSARAVINGIKERLHLVKQKSIGGGAVQHSIPVA